MSYKLAKPINTKNMFDGEIRTSPMKTCYYMLDDTNSDTMELYYELLYSAYSETGVEIRTSLYLLSASTELAEREVLEQLKILQKHNLIKFFNPVREKSVIQYSVLPLAKNPEEFLEKYPQFEERLVQYETGRWVKLAKHYTEGDR